MASWRDLDFYDFVGWHSAVCLKEVMGDRFDLRIRLFGTYFVECFDADMTGYCLSVQPGQSAESNQRSLLYYKEICQKPCIGINYGAATWIEKHFMHFTILGLPLADDGHTTTHALSLLCQTTPEAPMTKIN